MTSKKAENLKINLEDMLKDTLYVKQNKKPLKICSHPPSLFISRQKCDNIIWSQKLDCCKAVFFSFRAIVRHLNCDHLIFINKF